SRRRLDELRAELARLCYPTSAPDPDFARRIAAIDSECNDIERRLLATPGHEQPGAITKNEIARSLHEDEVLLDCVRYQHVTPDVRAGSAQWGPFRYAVLVLRSHLEPFVVDVGEAVSIETAVRDVRAGWTAFEDEDDWEVRARALYETL